MGQVSKALGTPVEFQACGQTWKLSPWNYGIIGEYENYLQEHAMRTVRRMRKFLSDEEYASLAAKTCKDITSGLYTFGSEEVRKTLDSYQHFAYLTWLSLRDNHPDLTYEGARDLAKEAGELLVEKMQEANSDPNRKTPAQS